jgi:hypothetical protein
MTRFYQLWKRVPRERRKALAKFIHELKKLASATNECIVVERLGNRANDYVYVEVDNLSTDERATLLANIRELGDTFALPRTNIVLGHDVTYGSAIITCNLYTDY